MNGPYLVSLALLVSIVGACAQGEGGGLGGSGSSSPGSGGDASIGATTSTGQGGGTSTSSSTSSGGAAPTTCAQAHGSVGCCDNDTVYYCKTGTSTLTVTPCTSGKVCGWEASKSYYTCVAAPGGPDPSNANPEQCN